MLRRMCRLPRFATLHLALGCACAVATIAIACSDATAPLPAGAIEWSPPARFALWWQMTESCSGRQGDLSAIRWYVVPNATSITVNGKQVQGETIGTDRIILVEPHRLDGSLVRHEMLHALLGVGGHPRAAFLEACNGVVVCDSVCAADAGGRTDPPPDAPELTSRDVATRLEVVPRQPAVSQDSGAVAVIISITNPLATPAWVRLVPPGSQDAIGYTFGLALDYDDSRLVFLRGQMGMIGTRFPLAANETRRYVWDGDLAAGDYGVRGWFNDDSTPRFLLKVAP